MRQTLSWQSGAGSLTWTRRDNLLPPEGRAPGARPPASALATRGKGGLVAARSAQGRRASPPHQRVCGSGRNKRIPSLAPSQPTYPQRRRGISSPRTHDPTGRSPARALDSASPGLDIRRSGPRSTPCSIARGAPPATCPWSWRRTARRTSTLRCVPKAANPMRFGRGGSIVSRPAGPSPRACAVRVQGRLVVRHAREGKGPPHVRPPPGPGQDG